MLELLCETPCPVCGALTRDAIQGLVHAGPLRREKTLLNEVPHNPSHVYLKIYFTLNYLCVYLYACMCTLLQIFRDANSFRYPWTWFQGSCELPSVGSWIKIQILRKQYTLLTIEPSPQSQPHEFSVQLRNDVLARVLYRNKTYRMGFIRIAYRLWSS